MESPHDDTTMTYSYSVDPFGITLSQSEQARLATDTKRGIDRAIQSKELHFTETISSKSPVELYANPQLPPSKEYGVLIETAYNRAIVEMEREFIDGEYHFTRGSVLFYGDKIPLAYARTLHILANENTIADTVDLDDPQFYLEVPSIEQDQPDIIPLDYIHLQFVLEGLVAQSNFYAAITGDNRSIEENLLAILEMSDDRAVHRESAYQFSDPSATGHAVVAISQKYHFAAGIADPIAHRHAITVDNTLYLNGTTGATTTTYQLEHTDAHVTAQTGVSYENIVHDDRFEAFEKSVQTAAARWRAEAEGKRARGRKSVKFGHYIAMGLSRINNTADDPTSQPITRG